MCTGLEPGIAATIFGATEAATAGAAAATAGGLGAAAAFGPTAAGAGMLAGMEAPAIPMLSELIAGAAAPASAGAANVPGLGAALSQAPVGMPWLAPQAGAPAAGMSDRLASMMAGQGMDMLKQEQPQMQGPGPGSFGPPVSPDPNLNASALAKIYGRRPGPGMPFSQLGIW